ncbi:VOC family protein [Geodermatophilus sp. YIM 151500]|uniref:VOC family protein n=1 Tax=Geodermatophilus sp. YIM 151500 TaxID=2984531 RepID=UPI0021E3630E|nr:VOC family protein [Geodermatophilus sp. YIM 151500]MCV2491809.1 VOC family protein [Geodermatophilus sp. YIM 151500]
MDWKLEVVLVPVTDVDRAKQFYAGKLGFREDTDYRAAEDFRVVQVTPPGSACSIVFGAGMPGGPPGSLKGSQFSVADIEQAIAQLDAAGVGHSGPVHFVDGVMTPGPDPQRQDYATFLFFDDPDGNTWSVQEVRTPAR